MHQVLVLGHSGELLHPCNPARARQLLRNNRAKMVVHRPFTIQLIPTSIFIDPVAIHERRL
ncbi:MAG: hypothetical protein EBT06_03920 [Gammaproteobacteria bacterium]|nr:hypothetical protein [Gammaproteobacteria bacterium]NBY21368.1 hypothetical protein [Gammaproteobacteria bacterium]